MKRGLALVAGVACVVLASVGAAGAAEARTAPPSVTALSTTSGPTSGGTKVTLHGAHFAHVTKVRFGVVNGRSVHIVSSTTLTAVSPAHAAGTFHVRVVTAYGKSALSTRDRFRYVAPPTVSSVSPSGSIPGGGASVTIRGTNYIGKISVSFGTAPATSLSVASATELRVTAPAHTLGTVDVRVTTPYGSSATTASDRFTY